MVVSKNCTSNTRRYRRVCEVSLCHAECGALFVELAIALSFLVILMLGLAEQYYQVLNQQFHAAQALQIMSGPQLRPLDYDRTTLAVDSLSGSTTPTLTTYLDEIGNQFAAETAGRTTLIATLGYLNISASTGQPTGREVLASASYPSSAPRPCDSNISTHQTSLTSFATSRLSTMQSYVDPNTSALGEVGILLYNIRFSGTTYTRYLSKWPFIFVSLCSESLWGETVNEYMLVARRHLN